MNRALFLLSAAALPCIAAAQATDATDRNLLERSQREVRFGVSLYEEPPLPRVPPAGAPTMPITLLPPGINPLGDHRPQPAQPASVPSPSEPASLRQQDLERLQTSQQQRQQQLQLQNRELLEPARRQQSDTQQLIFERENRAHELGAEILRRSGAATGAR
jgi:hypothetical protein